MKKNYVLLLCALTATLSSSAQNTAWPGTADNVGVGIGTTSPRTRLEVAPPSNNSAVPAGIFRLTGHQSWGHVLTLSTDDSNGDDPRLLFSYRAGIKKWALGGYSNTTKFSLWEDSGDGVFGQGFGTERLTVLQGGNVGIGTSNPLDKLDVDITSNTEQKRVSVFTNTGTNSVNSPVGGIRFNWYGNNNAEIQMVRGYSATDGAGLSFLTSGEGGVATERMRVDKNGNVAIGTADSKGYKLAVAGNFISESVTVKLQTQWPDYVFEPTFKLLSLSEVKAYIDKNQHLPDMPSEAEVKKSGVELGEMVKLQTKKLEELTLYLIQQQKEINMLKRQLRGANKK